MSGYGYEENYEVDESALAKISDEKKVPLPIISVIKHFNSPWEEIM